MLVLDESESRHAAQVIRLRAGEGATVLDGRGGEWACTAVEVNRREVRLRVDKTVRHEPPAVRLRLVQAITKGKSFELVLQKAVELGVTEIQPLISERVVARPDPGEFEGKVERLDVVEELEASIEGVFPPGAGFDSHVERHFEHYLPTLLMQRGHLREIFTNLFQNAREAVAEVGDSGHIKVVARQDPDDAVVVVVEDNGPGIPSDKLEQVFEAYYTTRAKGTGLGLAIARNNIELYGGSVKAESELGKGARFILRFPPRTVLK
jgi:signal transduction histidine kinase